MNNRYYIRLKRAGEKDYLNSKELYAPFKDIDFVTLFHPISGQSATKSVELPEETKNILVKIGKKICNVSAEYIFLFSRHCLPCIS